MPAFSSGRVQHAIWIRASTTAQFCALNARDAFSCVQRSSSALRVPSPSRVRQRLAQRVGKRPCYQTCMINTLETVALLSDPDLLAGTHELVDHSLCTEADLLVYLSEIDERKLYADRAFPSMFAFCVGELRFSEDAAYSRIMVARASRRLPAMIEATRSGQVHLTGLRLLAPHLTAENHCEVLAEAAGRTKREIEELVARLAPQPGLRLRSGSSRSGPLQPQRNRLPSPSNQRPRGPRRAKTIGAPSRRLQRRCTR